MRKLGIQFSAVDDAYLFGGRNIFALTAHHGSEAGEEDDYHDDGDDSARRQEFLQFLLGYVGEMVHFLTALMKTSSRLFASNCSLSSFGVPQRMSSP